MKLCLLGKLPPTKGGVARLMYQTTIDLTAAGVDVHVVTNADEVEPCHRQLWSSEDHTVMARKLEGVTVHQTQTVFESQSYHIPLSPAYETKLFALAMRVVQENDCDAIMGWYFQPFGFVASLVGRLLNKPVILMHAGSDIGFLPNHPQLSDAYRFMVASAHTIITGDCKPVLDRLRSLGASDKQLRFPDDGFNTLLPEFRDPLPFDLDTYTPLLREYHAAYCPPKGPIERQVVDSLVDLADKPLDTDAPTIGVYGKVGVVKGSVELLEALQQLACKGLRFNFVQLACGRFPILDHHYREVLRRPELAKRSWVLPTIAPWRIPGYLDTCDITCFLENRFGISFHTPTVPREILARGSCFVCSGEVADSGIWKLALDDGDDVLRVDDPHDIDDLAARLEEAITQEDQRRSVAELGRFVSEQIEAHSTTNHVATLVRRILGEL